MDNTISTFPNVVILDRKEWLKNAIEGCKQILKDDPYNCYWKIQLDLYRKELACL